MNEHDVIQELKSLRNLTPDETFCRTSLSLILAKKPASHETRSVYVVLRREILDLLGHASVLGAAAFLIILTVAAFNFVSTQSPLALNGVNLSNLVAEADSIDIHIDLPELNYIDGGPNTTGFLKGKNAPLEEVIQEFSTLSETSADAIDQLLEELSR